MVSRPPAAPVDENNSSHGQGGTSNYLSIDSLHYHANDLAELRKLAESSPLLAEKIIDQRDREHARENTSFRIGLLSTIALVMFAIGSLTFMLVKLGVIASICAILGILAIALLIRVILTGEWSETSWFGKGITGLVTMLGGKPEPED